MDWLSGQTDKVRVYRPLTDGKQTPPWVRVHPQGPLSVRRRESINQSDDAKIPKLRGRSLSRSISKRSLSKQRAGSTPAKGKRGSSQSGRGHSKPRTAHSQPRRTSSQSRRNSGASSTRRPSASSRRLSGDVSDRPSLDDVTDSVKGFARHLQHKRKTKKGEGMLLHLAIFFASALKLFVAWFVFHCCLIAQTTRTSRKSSNQHCKNHHRVNTSCKTKPSRWERNSQDQSANAQTNSTHPQGEGGQNLQPNPPTSRDQHVANDSTNSTQCVLVILCSFCFVGFRFCLFKVLLFPSPLLPLFAVFVSSFSFSFL